MSWKFGTIDFSTFEVKVSHTTGLLDLPKLQFDGTDWLDVDGKDYWQDDTKYNDREIQINCWIVSKSGGYASFKTKVEAFEEAIKQAGKTTLYTPYGDINVCSISRGITISRESNYLPDLQGGTFTLMVTAHGDTQYGSYPVYDWATNQIKTVLLTKTMKVQRILQGDNYATCTIETNEPISIHMYDYVSLNTNGVNGEPYYFMSEPEYRKLSSNKYQYNIRLEHGSILLKQSQFLFNGESDFPMYADLETIVDMICNNNIRFISSQKFRKGTVAPTERRNHIFKGEDCFALLKRITHEYNLEYDIRWTVPGAYYTIDVVDQIAATKSISMEYGKGKGLYEINREPVNKDELVTVLYAYGSTKNLKPDYRGGKRRLEFTGNPLRMNDLEYMGIEDTVFFDDIFPNRTANVTAYSQKLPPELTKEEKEVWPGGIYRIVDGTLDFDLNDYLLGGLTAKIRMKSGSLAGMEFEIERYDHGTKEIFIIPFKDERGELFPNDVLTISVGDQYTLLDIDQPESYVTVAETELYNAAVAELTKRSTPRPPYSVHVHPSYTKTLSVRFDVGDRITIVDTPLNINGEYRISSLTYDPLVDDYRLRLSEHRILTKREQIEIRLSNTERAIEFTNSQKGEVVKKEQETTNELKNRLFDPADDLQDLDKTVRNESVDPRMLAYDAGVPQFSLRNALVECNVDGDYNKVKVGAGQLIMHNWEGSTKDRYEIMKIKKSGGTYDPTRIWIIEETTFNLPTNNGYWLYAKLTMAEGSTACQLLVEEDHIEVKEEVQAGYLKYKLGHISDQASPRYAAMLWGNVKYGAAQPEQAVIYQPNHGLLAEQAIRHNGTIYVLAKADNDVNAQVCGIVSEVIDADHFRYVTDGFISGGSWVAGSEYFLSPSVAGLVTTLPEPEVWSVGQVRISLGWATTQGLKVEIDVGDVIEELPAVRLKGIWDREFEFCINQGYAESFTADYYAVYPYKILELIIGVDNGTLPASSIQINGVPVTGLNNITISGKAVFTASNLNEVVEGNEVTVNTSGDYTGDPQVIKGKLKIMRE